MSGEDKLRKRVKDNLGKLLRLERIESTASTGHPDTRFGNHRTQVHGVIELKSKLESTKPARPIFTGKEGLRNSQKRWFKEWLPCGVRAYILAYAEETHFLFQGDTYCLLENWTYLDLKANAIVYYMGRMTAGDWRHVANILGG